MRSRHQTTFKIFTIVTMISLLSIESFRFSNTVLAAKSPTFLDLACDALFAKFSMDGNSVVTTWRTPANDPAEMRLWNIQTDKVKLIQTFDGELNSFIGVPNFSPDGKFLLVGYNSKAILWNIETGEQVYVFERDNSNSTDVIDAFFSSDGLYIITSGSEGVNLWETKSGKKLHHFSAKRSLLTAQISADNKYLMLTEVDGGVTLWSVRNENKIYTFSNAFNAIFSTDSNWIITTGYDGLNVQTISEPNQTINLDTKADWRTLDVSFDDKYLLTVDYTLEHLSIWDIATRSQIKTFEGKGIEGKFFPEDDAILLSNVHDEDTTKLEVWDIQSHSYTKKISDFTALGDIYDISRDGNAMLGFFDSNVQLRDLKTGKKVFDIC
ncbi:MAG: hypothetical protein ABI970_08435 [Chloroflexota bacterium]